MKELEVKILEIDKEIIISKLQSLGATKTFEGQIIADFFINDEWKKIRLRKKDNRNIITYKIKQHNESINQNIEYETNFDNHENMIEILKNIGFRKYWNSSKYRISYSLWKINFDLDKYENIPRLVEIEAQNMNDVKKWVKILWYNMDKTSTLTEWKLKEFYNKNCN